MMKSSCLLIGVSACQAWFVAGALARELSRDPAFLDIAVRSMNQGFDHLGSMAHLRWTPYIVSVLEGDGKVDDAGIMIETERTPSCDRGLND